MMKLISLICSIFLYSASSFGFCTVFAGVPLRSKPSSKSESIKADKYTPLKWTGTEQGKFLQVEDFRGRRFWVNKKQVSEHISCLSVSSKKTKLRTGPGKEFETLPIQVSLGDSFLDLGGEDGWTMVLTDSGERAWLNMDDTWKPFTNSMRMSFGN